MIATLLTLLSGPAFGSVMKMVGGFVDRKAAIEEAREKRKLAAEIGKGKIDAKFQEQVFGTDAGGMYARATRRTLAIIGMLTLCITDLACIAWPTLPIHTFALSPTDGKVELLFGLISWAAENDTVVVVSTGHLAIAITYILSTIVGFYFTPGGRK